MSKSDLQSPSEVATELNISPSTLRRWSTEFGDFLSESAGRPELSPQGEPLHRRYTEEDVRLLGTISQLLNRGLTYREIAAQLQRMRQGLGQETQGGELTVLHDRDEPHPVLSSAISFLGSTMERVVEGQQVVLSSQQANRDLLGLVIQDNFNLKEENSRLRERMLKLERELSELQRQEDALRREVLERLLEMERKEQDSDTVEADEQGSTPRPKGCLTRWLGFLF